MNIELQVGKRYERADGEVGKCVESDERGTYPFAMNYGHGRHWYTAGGKSIAGPRYDITREITDSEPATHPDGEPVRVITDEQAAATLAADHAAEPVSDTHAPLRLEVGKWYRCRDGEVVKVERIDTGDDLLPFLAGGVWYSSSGKSCVADEYPGCNLIEEIPAHVAEAVAEMEFTAGEVSPALSGRVDLRKYGVTEFPDLGVKLEGDTLSGIDGPATEKVTLHWDREGVTGYTPAEQQSATEGGTENGSISWLRVNLADTRAGIARKYAQAAMFVMLGIAAVIFAIGTSVQA